MKLLGKESIQHTMGKMNVAIYDHPFPWLDASFQAHWHSEYELTYVYEGVVNFELDGKPYQLNPNEVLFVNPNIIHSCNAPLDYPGRFACIVFGEKFLFPDLADAIYEKHLLPMHKAHYAPPAIITPETPWGRSIIQDAKDLFDGYFLQEPAFELNLRVRLLSIFYTFIRYGMFEETTGHQNIRTDTVREALSIIQQNYAQPLTVKSLADACGVCQEHLCRTFKAIAGQPPKEYIMRYRIEHAAAQLVTSDDSIASIASLNGFDDTNYFSRCFKKLIGMTPRAYKENFR